ncbi:MAG TPA: sugar phosphate isomerase/epimerase, partial [bacterium]|nr:sugar phosphate isomerase/epimerase [bacterium]
MKLGVFLVLFGGKKFEEALEIAKGLGLDAVEIGAGNYPGNAHCNPDELLADDGKLKTFSKAVERYGLEISALSCH